jgi:hypothetical protein
VGALQPATGGRLSVLDEVLRAHARHRRASLDAAVLLLAALAGVWLGHSGRPPGAAAAGTGAVSGYLQPCSGLPFPQFTSTGARVFSAAATVAARRGREHWKPVGDGDYQLVMPTAVAAREQIGQNQEFRLGDLAPGRYVIVAQYAGGNVSTFLDVTVHAGQLTDVELPNPCL